MSEPSESQIMPERWLFPLTSGEGYGAVIHGNFVRISIGMTGFYASVYALLSYSNSQFKVFDNPADAVEWAVTTARTHQGQQGPYSKNVYWEIRHGYSITIEPEDSVGYEADIFPLWIDLGPEPMRIYKRFPEQDEALQWARQAADEQAGHDVKNERTLQQIREALESHHS